MAPLSYTVLNGSHTSITNNSTYGWTLADTSTAGRQASRSIMYMLSTASFTTSIDWTTSGADSGEFDQLYYYVGNTLADITGVDLNASATKGDFATYNTIGWSKVPGFLYNSTTSQSGTLSVAISSGQYFALMIDNGNGLVPSTITLTGVPTADGACFTGDMNVIMADGSNKKLKDVKRGDMILEDKATGKTNMVARLYSEFLVSSGYKIKKGLIGNTDDIVCTKHPIWCNNDQNRIMPENIIGSEPIMITEFVYDIQFEDEGTFYVNDIKVDSLPPYNGHSRLSEDLYFTKEKYEKYGNYLCSGEDDPIRNKPPMIN